MSVQCQHPGDNHSTDYAHVYYGAQMPVFLCGYHQSRLEPAMFAELRAAGIIPA